MKAQLTPSAVYIDAAKLVQVHLPQSSLNATHKR